MKNKLQKIKVASYELLGLDSKKRFEMLRSLSREIINRASEIIQANKLDLIKMNKEDPMHDRLLLTRNRVNDIAGSVEAIAKMDDVLDEVIEERRLDNGLRLCKYRVSLGVVGVIYESRPNVTADVFALTFKSGNACVLKGGSDAVYSNQKFIEIIKDVLQKHKINEHCIGYFDLDREEVGDLLHSDEYIDVIIPRGSKGLIEYVRNNATIPVIETGAGVVHTYFSRYGDISIGRDVINNAKTRRPSVCNSLDTLIIDSRRLNNLYELVYNLEKQCVIIYSDKQSYKSLKGKYRNKLLKIANDESFGKEYLSLQMSVKTVDGIENAIKHIRDYSSKHSEAIISDNVEEQLLFTRQVDAAVVYVNTSTAFTDGGEFGLGAEIGISTQKLHARGPMGLCELTSYKWVILGCGQIRQ